MVLNHQIGVRFPVPLPAFAKTLAALAASAGKPAFARDSREGGPNSGNLIDRERLAPDGQGRGSGLPGGISRDLEHDKAGASSRGPADYGEPTRAGSSRGDKH